MRAYLFAAALLVAFASPSSAQSWPGFPGPQGSGSSSGTAGASFTADPLVLDDGAGNVTYLSNAGADGWINIGTTDGGSNGVLNLATLGAAGVNCSGNLSLGSGADLYLRRSAASTLTVDSDGAGGAATLAVDKIGADGNEVGIGGGGGGTLRAAIGGGTTEGLRLADSRIGFAPAATNYATIFSSADTFLSRAEANVLRLDGDGSATTAAKLAVSGIAPMGSTTNVNDDLKIYDANGDVQVTFDTSAETISFSPGNSGTTRLTLLDSSNTASFNGNVSSTSGNWSISGFKRATFSYPSGGTEASGNSMHVADNDGAAGVATMTLPTPSEGYTFTFYVQDAQEFRVDPAANDKILDVDMTGLADGEYITSSTINSTITIMANGDGDWIVLSKTGTWAEETP